MAGELGRSWFERDAPAVAAALLNKVLVVTIDGAMCSGRITETEAYTQDDPASHTYRGRTERNSIMFGEAGHLYVYLSYGIHHCLNVVTGHLGDGQAVLLRAIDPLDGIDVMRERRGGRSDRDLSNGPGKLAQALGLGLDQNGLDLLSTDSIVAILDDGVGPPKHPRVGPRIGISKATAKPWRFRLPCPT